MPTDHGLKLDDNQRIPPALPDTAQKNPDHAVAVLRRRAFSRRAENLELMTEGDALEDQRFASAKWSLNQAQDEVYHPGGRAAGSGKFEPDNQMQSAVGTGAFEIDWRRADAFPPGARPSGVLTPSNLL
jgi:hypothetical protein